MDPTKLDGIRNWPTPAKVKDVHSFLGFANFYRKFIGDYSNITRPLLDLTKKDTSWNWNNSYQNAFNRLKNCFLTKPILHLPNTSKPFTIATDASKYASGSILLQADSMENGTHAPTCPNRLEQQNETTTSMTENSLLSFVVSRFGTTTYKDHHPQYRSSPTIKISCSLNKHKNSTGDRPDGCWTWQTTTSNSYMSLEANSVPQMHYPDYLI